MWRTCTLRVSNKAAMATELWTPLFRWQCKHSYWCFCYICSATDAHYTFNNAHAAPCRYWYHGYRLSGDVESHMPLLPVALTPMTRLQRIIDCKSYYSQDCNLYFLSLQSQQETQNNCIAKKLFIRLKLKIKIKISVSPKVKESLSFVCFWCFCFNFTVSFGTFIN